MLSCKDVIMILFCLQLLFLLLPMTSRAQDVPVPRPPQCSLDVFSTNPFPSFDDGDRFVRLNLTCNTPDNIMVELDHNYIAEDGRDISDGRLQLFYQCTNPTGNVSNAKIVPRGSFASFSLTRYKIDVSSPFNVTGAFCEVWGCYEVNVNDNDQYRAIYTIENSTCTIEASTTEPPTVFTIIPTTTLVLMKSTLNSISMTSLSPTTSFPLSTGAEPSLVPTVTPTDLVPIVTPNLVPTGPPSLPSPSNSPIIVVVVVIIIIIVALICVSVLVGIILRLHQVQRKKHSMMRYYNYHEPIDPHFNPIDINARVKSMVSLVSEFDILMPQTHPADSTDDERSQVLQGANNSSDASSVKSIKFVDDSSETNTNGNNQQVLHPTKSGEKPLIIKNESKEVDEPSQNNGYVAPNYLPDRHNPGYWVKDFKPSTIPLHNTQHQSAGRQANTVLRDLRFENELKPSQFGTQLSISSLSSGYVTDLKTPSSEYHKYLTSPDPGASMVTMRANSAVVSQYPVFDSVQPIDEELSQEDTNSVVYSIGDGVDSVECEAVEGVVEHKYAENIMAECSLSLNPLHFEPINYDELVEQITPSYVNTTPGAELFQTQFNH